MKYTRLIILNGLLLGMCLLSFATQYNVTPEVYKVTISKVEVYNTSTGQWVVIGEGDVTFDIASVGAGQIVGGYVTGQPIPEGVYTKVRVTVSRHMRIKAHINVGGTEYYTSSNSQQFDLDGGPGEDLVTTVVATTQVSAYTEGEVVSPSGSNGIHYQVNGEYFTDTQVLSTPFTVKKGMSQKLRIKFDVTNSAIFYDGDNVSPPWGTTPFFLPGTPTITIERV